MMDLAPQQFFQTVSDSLQNEEGHDESLRLLDTFNRNLIEEQIDSALLDSYFPHFFHTSNSLINFVDGSSKSAMKNFKKACVKAIEILYTILDNFFHRLVHEDIISLYTIASRIIKSGADSMIKVKLFDLVIRSLEKSDGLIDSKALPAYLQLYKSLLSALRVKSSGTVKGKEMETVGYFSKKYSFAIEDPGELKKMLLLNFDRYCYVTIGKISQYTIRGFYLGFGYFLENFELNLEMNDDKKYIEKMYNNLRFFVKLNPNDRVKLGNRAALSFLGKHTFLFKENLYKDYPFWHEKLLLWLTYGQEEKKVGAVVLRAFYQSLATTLEEKADPDCQEIVKYFVNYCRNILDTKGASNYEKRSSILCLREFSAASHKHLPPNDVTEIFLVIMQVFENTFIDEYDQENEEWEYLPDYVQTVANFMRFKDFTPSQFFCLQKGVISMVKSFHRLSFLHHNLVIDALVMSTFYLKNTQYFDTFVENVVYQGVVWSCSHQHIAIEAFADEIPRKLVTVKNYHHLWRGLLKLTSNHQYDKHDFHFDDRKSVLERIINELIKTLMILINKLNVSVSVNDENVDLTDIEKVYKVEEINDYAIFLNVVDFYKDILENIEPKMFKNCINKMMDHLIAKCLKYPLVSGFYKLLSFCLKISRKISLFQNGKNSRETLTSFLTVLLNKMVEYKDDLLISCLQVLLETPIEILEPLVSSCVVPFINIFEVGRSYLPLAEMGVDTLEYWQDNLKIETFEPFLAKIIPSLDSFLRSKFLRGASAHSGGKRRKTVVTLKKRKVLEEAEAELVKLQRKILCFVGRQSLKNCRDFIFSDKSFGGDAITGESSHLKVTLPYGDLQLDVYLDTFLPRIIELAMYCSDRKTRINSCELLQACVMVFLGRAKQMSLTGLEESNTMLKTLATPLLHLGCDIDQVVKQIFEPLFLQLVHWYTSPTQTCGTHTSIIIETLLDGITHPTNSSLKDFSGKCINEYVKWTMKHKKLDPNASVKVLVKRMRFFSHHPDPAKKLGSALIFNNIYRELREEEGLVSIFWLEILHIFVQSLDSLVTFEETTTVGQIKNSISHLQRVIMEKPGIFRKPDEKRRIPNYLEQGLLTNVSIWLLNQTASNSKHCRETCKELFVNLTPLTVEKRLNLHEFVEEHLDTTVASLYDSKLGLRQYSIEYLRNFLCCLDGYHFIVKNNLEAINFDEAIFEEVQNFAGNLNLMGEGNLNFTSSDKETFVNLKTTCIVSIFRLYNGLVGDKRAGKLWSREFWNLLANAILYPQDLGLFTGYTDLLTIFLNVIPKKLDINDLKLILQKTIDNHEVSAIHMEKNVTLKQRNLLKGAILLSNTALGQQMELIAFSNKLIDRFVGDFREGAKDGVVFVNHVPDTTFSYVSALLNFAVGQKGGLERLVEQLHSELCVQSVEMAKKISFGLYLVSTFAESIVPAIVEDFETFLRSSLSNDRRNITIEIVIHLLGYIIKEKSYKTCHKDVVNNLLMYWSCLVEFFETEDKGVEFLTLFVQICDSGSADMQRWLVSCLMEGRGKNDMEIFGLLAKMSGNDLDAKQSDHLRAALSTLNEKISSQTSNEIINSNNFNKLLTFLPLVKSTMIFQYLLETYVKITTTATHIAPLIYKFVTNLDKNLQETFLDLAYTMEFDNFEQKYKIATNVLPILYQHCDMEVFQSFSSRNIRNVLEIFEKNDLEKSIIHFILIEILFLRIPIGSADCPITASSGKPKLLPELLKHPLNAFKIDTSNELARRYKCHAYNCLASIVSNSLKQANFYEKLFIRKSGNADILWHGIVNTDVMYDFPREFDTLPSRKKFLVSIRDEMRKNRDEIPKNLHYIESVRLYSSSLSEDITKFDFTNSVLRSESRAQRKMAENELVQSAVYLDMTEINNHECMGTVCSLIQHIFDTGISELPTEADDDVLLPNWMDGIRTLLSDENTHKNVKIFLVKVIDNEIEIFSRYAKFFLEPLIQFVVEKCAGDNINYFVTDVLVIISKWATEIPNLSQTESILASKLLEHFIKNIENDRRDVFKYNIELLKLLVEAWKNHLAPPVDAIFQMLSSVETAEIAIHVSSVLLVNKLEVWQRGSEKQFLSLMLKQLDSKNRTVYRACAETLGPLLAMLDDVKFTDVVKKKLNAILAVSLEKFVVCLEGIAVKYPTIIDEIFVGALINLFNTVPVPEKMMHLKIINKKLEMSLDVLDRVSEFRIVDWHVLIEHPTLEIQILTVEIVKKCLNRFSTYPDYPKIVAALSRNVCHANSIFRGCLYDTAIAACDLQKDLQDSFKDILIFGLIDPDLDNQNKIMNYWSQSGVLPGKVIDRFSFLLSEMYRTRIEDKLLGYSTYFLLGMLDESEKYDSEIFEHPLEDCDFEEYKLRTNWRVQHPSVVPMFAETLEVGSLESPTADEEGDVFILRRTQMHLEFAPTLSFQEQQLSKLTTFDSTLALDTSFKDPNSLNISQKYKSKKRFLKDKSKISRNMAHYETHKQIQKVQERIESAIEKERKVTIYRSYRKGDFPDIQITLSAILKPLQILALHDSEISKILFQEMFKGLSSKIENNQNFLTTISEGIRNIFATSVQFNRYLFGALLDILLKNELNSNFDPSLIAYVAQESGLSPIGALVLEEYIISGDDGPSNSKRIFLQEDRETLCWIKLAELYKDLEEWDTVRSIFLQKMDRKESIQKALIFESESKYREAQELYEELMNTDQSLNRKDFYYESYFKCFANLGEWERIPTAVESVTGGENTWKTLWEDDWCKQKLLPWYITSKIKTQLFEGVIDADFLVNMNERLKESKNNDHLTSNYSEELCVLWLMMEDMTVAEQYLKTTIKNFLDDWQVSNPLFQARRFQKLLKLQNVIEIADFTRVYNTLTDDVDVSLRKLADRWSKNDVPPSVLFGETRVLYRKQFIDIVLDKLSKMEGLDLSGQIKDMRVAKVRMDVDLIYTAAEFGSFYVTRKYLRQYRNNENDKLDLAKGTALILRAKIVKTATEKMDLYVEGLNIFGRVLKSKRTDTNLKTHTKIFDVLADITHLLSNNPDLSTEYQQQLETSVNRTLNSPSDIERHAFDVLRNAAENCNVEPMDVDDDDADMTSKFKDVSDAYIKLAYFVRDKDGDNMQGDFILFVLRAMRLNASEGRQLFPCILMQSDLSGLHKEMFIREVEKIPTWMFLGWIPQLLANVDTRKIFAISGIILRISETYPQAIMYPYRLSKENYNFNDADVASEAKKLTDRLDELLLKDETVNKFLKALSYVSLPASILKYYVDKIRKSQTIENVHKYVQMIQTEFFDEICGINPDDLQGVIFDKIDKVKCRKEFSKLSNIGNKTERDKFCANLTASIEKMLTPSKREKASHHLLLKNYSPWLDSFSANKMNVEIEIPGQYDGQKLPLPQHHVKISGFYQNVKIMDSLRKPIKITMLGMNNKEYPFLIKFGEDIRQDQRIQQLFCLMNEFLKNDTSCSNNGLDILTYQVIPLTSNLGLIQWVDDTQSLGDFIKKSLKNKKEMNRYEECYREYERNLNPSKRHFDTYGKAATRIKREKIVLNYQTLISKIPWDILRTSFWSLSTSTENYIALRNNFIKTYAVICATHWILGIGDRHLTNSLICLKNGKVLGIDFGHAFGTATQILPVPELVPFRLTPHLIGLMEPLKEKGPFREYMIHCMRCLRSNNLSMLATMQVFIQEPSIDWLEHAGLTDDSQVTDDSQSTSWYPVTKIEQAKRKLRGANSVEIMIEELKDGSRDEDYTAAYVKHVKGEPNDLRAKFDKKADLSVEDQVDCLIDHATDYNLLGRMWIGWLPWV